MVRLFFRILVTFLAVTGAVLLLSQFFSIAFANGNFWDHHGVFFLVFITFFPRLTLLFSSVVSGGVIWWLAWLFAPRVLVATLATLAYWNQNPILVVIAWLVAVGGESSEKFVMVRRSSGRARVRSPLVQSEIIDVKAERIE